MPDDFPHTLEATKQANLGHLLMKAARLVNELGIARVNDTLDLPMRAAHTRLFPHLDLEGTRQTTLAERIGISKQAVGQLIADLEAEGVVERVPDPSDRRARLVCFTQKGQQDILRGLAVLAQLEADLAKQLSAQQVDRLKGDLRDVLAVLESGALASG